MKKLLFVLLSFSLLFSYVTCYAKEYSLDSATFDVVLSENGDATVTETWDVNYIFGDFTRFYKEIYTDVSELEQYDSFSVSSVTIDGVPAKEVFENKTRADNTYYIEDLGSGKKFQWFKHVSNQKVEYKITYVLTNVVKKTDYNQAVFSFRYTCKDFSNRVDKVTVNITAPGAEGLTLRYPKDLETQINGNTLSIYKNNHTGLLKYTIAVSDKYFDYLHYIQINRVEKSEKATGATRDYWKAILSLLLVLYAYIHILIKKQKTKKLIESDPTFFKRFSEQYRNMDISEIISELDASKSGLKVFSLFLFDFCNKGKASIKSDFFEFDKSILDVEDKNAEFLKFIKKYLFFKEENGKYIVRIDEFKTYLEGYKRESPFFNNIKEICPRKKKEDKTIKIEKKELEMINAFINYSPEYKDMTAYDYYKLVQNTGKIDLEKIIAFAFLDDKKIVNKRIKHNEDSL